MKLKIAHRKKRIRKEDIRKDSLRGLEDEFHLHMLLDCTSSLLPPNDTVWYVFFSPCCLATLFLDIQKCVVLHINLRHIVEECFPNGTDFPILK